MNIILIVGIIVILVLVMVLLSSPTPSAGSTSREPGDDRSGEERLLEAREIYDTRVESMRPLIKISADFNLMYSNRYVNVSIKRDVKIASSNNLIFKYSRLFNNFKNEILTQDIPLVLGTIYESKLRNLITTGESRLTIMKRNRDNFVASRDTSGDTSTSSSGASGDTSASSSGSSTNYGTSFKW